MVGVVFICCTFVAKTKCHTATYPKQFTPEYSRMNASISKWGPATRNKGKCAVLNGTYKRRW